MVRAGKRWFAWMAAACCAAVSAIAQAAPEDVEEETEEVADAESAFVGAGGFSAALFRFVTIVQDDGTDKAGGWQAAATTLNFVDGRHLFPQGWACQVYIGMPIRHSTHGVIPPQEAARVTAVAATNASTIVMHRRPQWLRALFCLEFEKELLAQLNMQKSGLGATVSAR
ncbi:hypothetical protein [Polyangium mundeleinium]|uniref:Uncharacterized protein n=1 Tax=Polyangium mundeleinium TaxID=2995306 RepID=A0ABT5F575_9BACT|nr:hypothetical protein [Polyangium mundeleinium]MDC0749241.1 hypothetical protein [Polyangium mundeleinium]